MKPRELELTKCQFQFELIISHAESSNDTRRTDSKYVIIIDYRVFLFTLIGIYYTTINGSKSWVSPDIKGSAYKFAHSPVSEAEACTHRCGSCDTPPAHRFIFRPISFDKHAVLFRPGESYCGRYFSRHTASAIIFAPSQHGRRHSGVSCPGIHPLQPAPAVHIVLELRIHLKQNPACLFILFDGCPDQNRD